MIPFCFHMSEDLEILQKHNGNKITLRLLSYLGKMMFSKNYQVHIPIFSVETSITRCFTCGTSFASEQNQYVVNILLHDLSLFKYVCIPFRDFYHVYKNAQNTSYVAHDQIINIFRTILIFTFSLKLFILARKIHYVVSIDFICLYIFNNYRKVIAFKHIMP